MLRSVANYKLSKVEARQLDPKACRRCLAMVRHNPAMAGTPCPACGNPKNARLTPLGRFWNHTAPPASLAYAKLCVAGRTPAVENRHDIIARYHEKDGQLHRHLWRCVCGDVLVAESESRDNATLDILAAQRGHLSRLG